jgi:PAS domain S-box-containing protein
MRSVLIVEDERIVAKDLQQTLIDMGYDAFAIAASADEAVKCASGRCPDVVLMDIRIKGDRDGIETADVFRQRFDVPVVYLTAHADDATIQRAKKTEPYGYLLKPVKSGELRSAIEVSLHRHEMETRLRERERWFSTTLESIADAVVTVDLAGKISFMNAPAERLTGIKLADAVGRPARDVVRLLAPADPSSPLDAALALQQTVWVHEASLAHEGGAGPIISDSAAPVMDRGQMLGAVMVFRDVTEEKLLQKQLELGDRLASLGTMAAGVAHEVNNPLAVVAANASYVREEMARLLSELRAGPASHEALRRVEEMLEAQSEIQSAATRIARIVADLKAFSRPVPASPGHADVGRAVEWSVRSTSHQLRHRARIVAAVPPLPPVAIDETRLGQILVNLLINAAHAIPPGNLEGNQVSVTARAAEGERVVIEVRDTGAGMPPETAARIFEPFFTTKAIGEGTGLGLPICHGIATSVGGDIQVESKVGSGTVVRVILPVASGASAPSSVPPARARAPGERRGRILVVDDEEMLLRSVRRVLEGHDVTCTTSAREALAMLERGEAFDVIVSDLMMPNMTGTQFYEELLKVRPEDARRVVFLSGGALSPKDVAFLEAVPNLRIEKPFQVAQLRKLVEQLLASFMTP